MYFDSLIVSKLSYGLSTVSLVKSQRRRLDGFYARCLRKILRVQPAYYSRVSNKTVLDKAGVKPFSEQILLRQMLLLGKVARSPAGEPLRRDTFAGEGIDPQIGRFVRVVGRPRQDWTNYLVKEGSSRMGHSKFQRMLADRSEGAQQRWTAEWKQLLTN